MICFCLKHHHFPSAPNVAPGGQAEQLAPLSHGCTIGGGISTPTTGWLNLSQGESHAAASPCHRMQ
jgi:hypothetical protein